MTDPTKLTDWRDACGEKWGEVCEAAGFHEREQKSGIVTLHSKLGLGIVRPSATVVASTEDPIEQHIIAALAHGAERSLATHAGGVSAVNLGPDGWRIYAGSEVAGEGPTFPAAWLAAAQRAWGEVGDG